MLGGSEAARQLRGQAQDSRGQRSLLNTFPFNQQKAEAHAEGEDHHEHHEAAAARIPVQAIEFILRNWIFNVNTKYLNSYAYFAALIMQV